MPLPYFSIVTFEKMLRVRIKMLGVKYSNFGVNENCYLYIPVNTCSYGHVETVTSPDHTFFLGKLD